MANFFGKLFKNKKEPMRPAAAAPPDQYPQDTPMSAGSAPTATPTASSGTGAPEESAATFTTTDTPLSGQSEFARSAHEAARQGLRHPAREINENTDLSSLTDAEIVRLMEGMEGDMLSKPLITGPVPLLAIKKEYLSGSKQVLRKLEWLEENGWDQVWRARGDGDCFYRSFTLAYLLRILYAPNPAADAAEALSRVHATLPSMEHAGFQSDLLDEFLEPFLSTIASFVDPPPGQEPTEYSLLQVLQNAEKSNCIVVALRLMTGAYIRTHPDDFAPFLLSPTTFEPVTPEVFCAQEVEPCGREADNAQIMALAAALKTPVRVAYLDRSEAGADVINWVEFEDAHEDNRPLTLLYRPGHFDVVAKDILHNSLVSAQNEEQANAVRADAAEIFAPGPSTGRGTAVAGGASESSTSSTSKVPAVATATAAPVTAAPSASTTTAAPAAEPTATSTAPTAVPTSTPTTSAPAPTPTSTAPAPAPGARPVPHVPAPTPAPGSAPAPAPAPTPAAVPTPAPVPAAPGPTAAPVPAAVSGPTATTPTTTSAPAAATSVPARVRTTSNVSEEEKKTPGTP